MAETCFDVDKVIAALLAVKVSNKGDEVYTPTSDVCMKLCELAQPLFTKEPSLLEISGPVHVVGDIRGCHDDLRSILDKAGQPSENNKYLFLGNYVDRGFNSLETTSLLFAYKIKYPDHVFLLRGNHESVEMTKIYGFMAECKRRLSESVWERFLEVFKLLPMAALVNNTLFCVHGGISPELETLQQIKDIDRPFEVPPEGLITDLLWSDTSDTDGWQPSPRTVSFTFGPDIVTAYLAKLNISMIIRSHTLVEEGCRYVDDRKVLTVFSNNAVYYHPEDKINDIGYADIKADGTVEEQIIQRRA